MSYLFYIDKSSKKVLHPNCLKLCPELGVLNEEETLWLILAYDYHSPFNQFPEEERQRKAESFVWGTQAPANYLSKEKIKVAIDAYKSLQYNPKIELMRIYQKKIDDLNVDLAKASKNEMIPDIIKTTKEIRKYIKELEDEVLGDEIEESHLTGNKELSWLETMQQNKDYYETVVKPKRNERKKAENNGGGDA